MLWTKLPRRPLENEERQREGRRKAFLCIPGSWWGLPQGHRSALGTPRARRTTAGKTAKQMFFWSAVLKAQRNFKQLWVGVLGIICRIKYKTDFSDCSYRARDGSWKIVSTQVLKEDDPGNDGDYYYFVRRKIKEPSINTKWAITIYWHPLKIAIVYPQAN